METTLVKLTDIENEETTKYYSITEKYCHHRLSGLLPEQAYRLAKGLNDLEKVSDRTLRYQEKAYRNLAFDPRKSPEIKQAAIRAYKQILSGRARKIQKLHQGEVVEIKEKPPISVMADLAKDTMEHNNPTIKKTQNLNINANISPVDLDKYSNKCKEEKQ